MVKELKIRRTTTAAARTLATEAIIIKAKDKYIKRRC